MSAKNQQFFLVILVLFAVVMLWAPLQARSQGAQPLSGMTSSFSYQGQLKKEGLFVNRSHDMQFKLYDAESAGNQVGHTLQIENVPVVDGIFSVNLDFGTAAFQGLRWLEIAVKPSSGGAYSTLEPRQLISPAPYQADLQSRVEELEAQISALTSLLSGVTRQDVGGCDTLRFSGMNVQIVNGAGSTESSNGRGNLIVGYNEIRTGDENTRTGSHYVIIGRQHNYSAYGGIVAGLWNTVSGEYASVSGGMENTASGYAASVSGGMINTASGDHSSVSGGMENIANGYYSAILGGGEITTSAEGSTYPAAVEARVNALEGSVAGLQGAVGGHAALLAGVTRQDVGGYDTLRFSGMNLQIVNGTNNTSTSNGRGNLIVGYNELRTWGSENIRTGSHYVITGVYNNYSAYGGIVAGSCNTASGNYASVSGGYWNTASGTYAYVSGGWFNVASGQNASVSGGYSNRASSYMASVSGGLGNTASGWSASVSGGYNNTASGDYSSVSGGQNNTASSHYTSLSGGRYNTAGGATATIGQWSSILGGQNITVEAEYGIYPAQPQ